jgi:hypothetical protein
MLVGLVLTTAFAALSPDSAASQVSGTLQNLLASLEEEGKQAEARSEPRRKWCEEQLTAMNGEVADYQDEAEQSQADVSEVKAAADEIAAASATLQRELQGKTGVQEASLKNQLSAELPLLASKRSVATELTRRASDFKHVLGAEEQATTDLQAECAETEKAEKAQAKSRLDVAMLLEKAKAIVAPETPGFLQVAELASTAAWANNVASQQANARLAVAKQASKDPLEGAREHLTELSAILRNGDSKDAATACAAEVKKNELLKAWKEDELARLGAEEKAHQQAVEQASEDAKVVEAAAGELKKRKDALEKMQTDGKAAEEKLEKDHTLLSKVVAQATTVLAATGEFKDGVQQLEQVSGLLANMPSAHVDFARASRSAVLAAAALDTEAGHIQLAQSSNEVSLEDMKAQTESAKTELAQVSAYLSKLKTSCDGKDEKVRREREVATLDTAVRDLNGASGSAPQALPGPIQPEVAAKLSPLQRAAMEMGVPSS